MAKPNYQFAKRQRDLAKKKKKEEKRLRKLEEKKAKAEGRAVQPGESEATPPPGPPPAE